MTNGKYNILIDSCFWIAYYDTADDHHNRALELIDEIEGQRTVVPWPTLYEFVNTELARRKERLYAFEQLLRGPDIVFAPDETYRDIALEQVFQLNRERTASVSLVDEILRQMVTDKTLNIDYLITFNRADFGHACQKGRVKML